MKKIPFLIMCALLSDSSIAEPSNSVRYLMNDPLTMFDWGIIQIQHKLDKIDYFPFESTSGAHLKANYDWDQNRLIIRASFYPDHAEVQKHGLKAICEGIHRAVTHEFKGQLHKDQRAIEGIASYFTHAEFTKKSEPPNLQDDIEAITRFKTTIYTNNPDEGWEGLHRMRLICSSDYLGDEIRYESF